MTAVVTAHVSGTNVRVAPVRVLDAEWIKLRTIRSWPWLTTVTALWLIGSAAVSAVGLRLAETDEGADPLGGALSGVGFTQLLVGTIGILSVTGEYRSGTIRSTFIAVPRRVSVVWSKAAVVALTTLAVTLPTVLIALAAAAGILSRTDTAISPTEPAVLRAVVGASLVLGLTAALGVAFGWLLRSTAGALTALFGFLVILPLVGALAPPVDPYLPGNAASAVLQVGEVDGGLPPWMGLTVLTAYVVVAMVASTLTVTRRDT